MTYEDPENLGEIIKDIIQMKSVQEILNLLSTVYPTFIKNTVAEYSTDYPHFDINWRGMCATLKVQKAIIILVDIVPEDDTHILIKTFCEVLTQAGFIVRRYTDFFPCNKCDKLLPSEEIYSKLKEMKIKIDSLDS